MTKQLRVSLGQATDAGIKPLNQDAIGACIPTEPLLTQKGIAVAIADGISSSSVSQIASETAVTSFLNDYYCTSPAWSVKNAAIRVLQATNSWLYSQTRSSPFRYNKDKGYICTFSSLVLKSRSAHLFHTGDTRIFRLVSGTLEQLTIDHRRYESAEVSFLSKALGINDYLELDYQTLDVAEGECFILASDGVYEHVELAVACQNLPDEANLNLLAGQIVQQAKDNGSTDNISIQLLRIEQLPEPEYSEVARQAAALPAPPRLQTRMTFDGFKILRELYISSRSHVFLAEDIESGEKVVIKTPSQEMRSNPQYLENFLMEDWIARRIDNPHVLRAVDGSKAKQYLYVTTEYLEGQTLAQWMQDNPKPTLVQVRDIVGQIIKGLQAFHRQEMLHQDLRPNNIIIDTSGTVKIIDFGAVRVAGVAEATREPQAIVGTAQYTAPEYFVHATASGRSDIFSLGVICYQMLSGHLPYGTGVAKTQTLAGQMRLTYQSLLQYRKDVPLWLDETLRRAVAINPLKRYGELSEFTADLHTPNPQYLRRKKPPLIERNPIRFWQGLSIILALLFLWQLVTNLSGT